MNITFKNLTLRFESRSALSSSTAGEYCAVINKDTLAEQHKGSTARDLFTSTTDAYCVAQFFIYQAEDMGSWVYGINRYGSSSSVAPGLVDVTNYDGVKAFQYSIQRSVGDAVYGRKYEIGATTYGANPVFKERGKYYGLCSLKTTAEDTDKCGNDSDDITGDVKGPGVAAAEASKDANCPGVRICNLLKNVDCILTGESTDVCAAVTDVANRNNNAAQQLFMGDGREDDSATALSTVTIQKQKYTRCLVCHGSQEFTIPQAQSSGNLNTLRYFIV